MFEVKDQKAKLHSLNCRAEFHGEEKVLASDLKLSITVSNDILSEFHPSLKSALYKTDDSPQGELMDTGELRATRFKQLGTIGWALDLTGYTFTLHHGIDAKSDIVLQDSKIDKFKFTLKDGGSVEVGFRVLVHPESTQLAKLAEHLQQEVTITATPPAPLDEQAGLLTE